MANKKKKIKESLWSRWSTNYPVRTYRKVHSIRKSGNGGSTSVITYLRRGKILLPNSSWQRGVKICESNNLCRHQGLWRKGGWGSCSPVGQSWAQCCSHRNIRVAVLPCSESTSCLFRTRPVEASDNLMYNEVFWVSISYPALRQKTLRVDVCTVDKSHLEECLVSIQLYFNNFVFVSSF